MSINFKPTMVTIHCSDTPNGLHASVDAIRQNHIARGFTDIGYHLIIQPDGSTDCGRSLNTIGAHVEGHNASNVGVCMIGKDRFTAGQFKRLKEFLETMRLAYNIQADAIYCHYEWDTAQAQGKTCPNIRLGNILVWYLTGMESAIQNYLLKGE